MFQEVPGGMACSASGKSFGRGPCPKWPAGREHCPTEEEQDSTGRQARRAPDADGVPEQPAGRDRWQRGIFCLFFELGRSLGLLVFEFESFLSN